MKRNNINKNLEKELNTLQTMVRMGLLNMDQFKNILNGIKEKYNLTIILREHNNTTDTRTIEVL